MSSINLLSPASNSFLRTPFTIAVSTSALYNTKEGWDHRGGLEGFRKYQTLMRKIKPRPGPAHRLIKRFLQLNRKPHTPDPAKDPNVKIHLISALRFKEAGRVMDALYEDFRDDLTVSWDQVYFARGRPLGPKMQSLGVHFYMAGSARAAHRAMVENVGAAYLIAPSEEKIPKDLDEKPFVMSFDVDGHILSDASEVVYQEQGLEAFQKYELDNVHVPMDIGPAFPTFCGAYALRACFGQRDDAAFQLALNTARGAPGQLRITNTLAHWYLDEHLDPVQFLAGAEKGPELVAQGAFSHGDDSYKHSTNAANHGVIGIHVPFGVQNRELIAKLRQIPDR